MIPEKTIIFFSFFFFEMRSSFSQILLFKHIYFFFFFFLQFLPIIKQLRTKIFFIQDLYIKVNTFHVTPERGIHFLVVHISIKTITLSLFVQT